MAGSSSMSGGVMHHSAAVFVTPAVTAASGSDTISAGGASHAAMSGFGTGALGHYGSATVFGGNLPDPAGSATMIGGTRLQDGIAPEFVPGGSSLDTLLGGAGKQVFDFRTIAAGSTHLITNFLSAPDPLQAHGNAPTSLDLATDLTTKALSTTINLHGGKTTIELQGITHPTRPDVTPHKP